MPSERMVYLAGPIDTVSKEDARGWRERASGILGRHGYAAFNPASCYANLEPSVHGDAVLEINAAAIGACGVLLAYVDEPTIGTCREIEVASALGKHIYVYSPNQERRNKLYQSIGASDCIVIDENKIGDMIQNMVNDLKLKHYDVWERLERRVMRDRVESEEDEGGWR